jgi:hypothetical protein
MYRAKMQAIKILEILIDFRSSVRLKHLLNDFKLVRIPIMHTHTRARVYTRPSASSTESVCERETVSVGECACMPCRRLQYHTHTHR